MRGGSRGKGGDERLAYYRGGFAELADEIASFIISAGGNVLTGNPVTGLRVASGRVIGVESTSRDYDADAVIATPALPIIADLVEPYVSAAYTATLRAVKYLANVCLVLELHRSLSDLYWINVNDLDFPFVAVIEHTNFEPKENYNGRVIVYLSKYLDESADLYRMADSELLNYAIPHIRTMFPDFDPDWIINHHVWRARYSQPVVVRRYSNFIVPHQTPLEGFFIATMAQIYPEDRGTNFAVRDGRKVGGLAARYVGEGT